MKRITFTFTQKYSNWVPPKAINPVTEDDFDNFVRRTETFDILEKLDSLERDVYQDRDYKLANRLIDGIRSKF